MCCEIISIGDELLIGQTLNTNARYLGQRLTGLGFDVKWISTVGDDPVEIAETLRRALGRADVVITTGGLGPTHDDITKTVVAEVFDSDIRFDEALFAGVKSTFERRGLVLAQVNREQAEVPTKALILANDVGTAPGLFFHDNTAMCFVLPGVPREMKSIFEHSIEPILRERGDSGRCIRQVMVHTTGIPESSLFEMVGDLTPIESDARVAFLPKPTGVDIRLMSVAASAAECDEKLTRALNLMSERVGNYVYGTDDVRLEAVVGQLLSNHGMTLAVAESCTGGMLANSITNVPGSSVYFERGVIAYSNRAKQDLLGVSEGTLAAHGAVSAETAEEMAAGVRRVAGADIGVSTTGIAGPTGGTPDKPVGLVYIGLAHAGGVEHVRHIFKDDRLVNKERTVAVVLDLLRRHLLSLQ